MSNNTVLNTYEIQFEQHYSKTNIPTQFAQQMELWKKYLAPLLSNCGFSHIGNMQVLGTPENMTELIIQLQPTSDYIKIKIKQINTIGKYFL